MYTHTHTRRRKNVMVGANLPPPELNRVNATLIIIIIVIFMIIIMQFTVTLMEHDKDFRPA